MYQPIYEYKLLGMTYRYESKVSGTGRKYRTIRRKVHMLYDSKTGKVVCKEEVQTVNNLMIFAGLFGLFFFWAWFIA